MLKLTIYFLLSLVLTGISYSSNEDYIDRNDEGYSSYKRKEKEIETGTFTDERDGRIYKTVKIGNQIWMAENLNYETSNSYCYYGHNCAIFGRHYIWSSAIIACPSGWRLPNLDDFAILVELAGGHNAAGKTLKSKNGWDDDGNGTDDFLFSAMPAGDRQSDGGWYFMSGHYGYFWSSSEFSGNYAYFMHLRYDKNDVHLDFGGKARGFSVRCLKGESGGSGGIGDGLAGLLGSGCGDDCVKGAIKTPSERDIDVVSSSRSSADIIRVVRQRTPGLRHIYDKFLKKKPGFQGKVALKFTIAPGGEVISISIVSSTTGYGEFDGEIKNAVSRWKFSRVESGITTVTIPFTFSE